MIATPSHATAFEVALLSAGVDVTAAGAARTLVVRDAGETLSAIMLDGRPDAAGFRAHVGELVRHLATRDTGLRIYGEMVALLWEQGRVTEALVLEELWNELGCAVPFTLFCGYPSALVDGAQHTVALDTVCRLHAAVLA